MTSAAIQPKSNKVTRSPLFKNRDFPSNLHKTDTTDTRTDVSNHHTDTSAEKNFQVELLDTETNQAIVNALLKGNKPALNIIDNNDSNDITVNENDHDNPPHMNGGEPIDSNEVSIGYTQSELLSICHTSVPGWYRYPLGRLGINPLHGGMTNALYVVYLKPEGEYKVDEDRGSMKHQIGNKMPSSSSSPVVCNGTADSPFDRSYDKVVVRVFGNDTSIFFNRTFERYVTKRLLQTTAGPRVLCEFPNGRIERFMDGRTLTCPHLHVPELCTYIATAVARFHVENLDLTCIASSQHNYEGNTFLTTPTRPLIFINIRQWLKIAKTIQVEDMTYALNDMSENDQKLAKQRREAMYNYLNIRSQDFEDEVNWLEKKLKSFDSPIVFCHNDLQEGNIIVDHKYLNEIQIDSITPYDAARQMDPIDETTYSYRYKYRNNDELPRFGPTWIAPSLPSRSNAAARVHREHWRDMDVSDSIVDASRNPCHLIDFEYSGWNYRAFDLANHFAEHYIDYSYGHWPYFVIIPSFLPSKQHMTSFIEAYLSAYHRYTNNTNPVTEGEVEKLLQESLWFMLASNLMWVPWGVIQAGKSNLNFGYLEYGIARYEEYLRLKDLLTSGDYNNVWQK